MKKILSAIISVALLFALLPANVAFAGELTIMPEHNFITDGNGEWSIPESNKIYPTDEGVVFAFNADSGSRYSISRKMTDMPVLPDGSNITLRLGFKVGEKLLNSSGSVMVYFDKTSGIGDENVFLFRIIYDTIYGLRPQFGSDETAWWSDWGYLDSNDGGLDLEFGGDYIIDISMGKNMLGGVQIKAVLYDAQGRKIASGTRSAWDDVQLEDIKSFSNITFQAESSMTPADGAPVEPFIYLKTVEMTAKYNDNPVEVISYGPKNGETQVPLYTNCYIEFKDPMSDVGECTITSSKEDDTASVSFDKITDENRRINLKLSELKPNTTYTVKVSALRENAEKYIDYEWSFATNSGVEFETPHFGLSNEIVTVTDFREMTTDDVLNAGSPEYVSGAAWAGENIVGSSALEDNFIKSGEVLTIAGLDGRTAGSEDIGNRYKLKRKISSINPYMNESLEIKMNIQLDNTKERLQMGRIMLGSDYGDNWTILSHTMMETRGWWPKGYGIDVLQKNQNAQLYKYVNNIGGAVGISSDDVASMGYTNNNPLTFTLKPNDDGGYTAALDYNGVLSTLDMTTQEAAEIDTLYFESLRHGGTWSGGPIMKISDLKVTKYTGLTYPVIGENKVYIDYKNLTENAFDATVLVVERDPDTSCVVNAKVVKCDNLIEAEGYLECPFSVENENSEIDVYIMNSLSDMILLSKPVTFTVGS